MKRDKKELPTHHRYAGDLKIRDALADLGSCWMYGPEFREAYNITTSTITRYKRQYQNYHFAYKNTTIWSGDPKTLRNLRKQINA